MPFTKDEPIKRALSSLKPEGYVLIDVDTGLVVSTNVLLVEWPGHPKMQQTILNNVHEAKNYAVKHGHPLFYNKARKK